MRKVVDSNYLQIPMLEEYLSASFKNEVVLIDYVAMEAYKGNTLKSITKSMSILAKYPKQVIILKGTQTVCGLKPRNKGMQKRYIDKSQTRNFEKYCKELRLAEKGSEKYQQAILEHGRIANEHIERMISDAEGIIESIEGIASDYTHEELRILRGKLNLTRELADKIIRNTLLLSATLFKNHPKVEKLPSFNVLVYSYIFRYSLSVYLLVINWISQGGAKGVKPKRMSNDFIDMHFVAYGTVFNGLLTNDQKAKNIYAAASHILSCLCKA